MIYIKAILSSVLFLLICSCNDIAKNGDTNERLISVNLEKISNPDFKEIFSSIEICPLETNSSSLIGNFFNTKKALYIPNKYYVVIDGNYVIHIFNMKGEFISNSSKCIGQGPQEYSILQDVVYNYHNNTLDILDPFGNISIYDINFNFISKDKIKAQTKDRFRKLFALNKSQYILFDNAEKGVFTIYDLNNNKTIKKISYAGLIAESTAITSPFNFSKDISYFTPPEVSNYLFIYKEKEMELIPSYYIEGGNKSIDKIDLNKFNSVEEKSEFILRDSPKYSPIDRLYNEKYIISTYIKQQELFINIYNLETNNNKTFKKDKNVSPNLPSFFSIEGKTVYTIIYPTDIGQFIDNDLITNKNILQTIKEDDNPCIIKYKLKL